MSNLILERLKALATEKNLSLSEISVRAVGNDSLIKNWFRKDKPMAPRYDSLLAVAEELDCDVDYLIGRQDTPRKVGSLPKKGLSVVGTIKAGSWIDTNQVVDENSGSIPIAENPKYSGMRQYALKVDGESMNLYAPHGSYVICVDNAELGMDLKSGMRVHVEQYIAGGQLVEATLKKVALKDKDIILEPESTSKNFKAINLSKTSKDTEVRVRGIVIGRYQEESI